MSKSLAALCLVATLASAQPVGAQVTVDLSKVTCNQWVGYKITNPQNIALWLSGFQHGKRGDTVVLSNGMIGKVVRVEEQEAGVEIAQNVTVKVVKSMIAEVRTRGEPAAANDGKA